jgi:hypothetical protein
MLEDWMLPAACTAAAAASCALASLLLTRRVSLRFSAA